jgi:CHASE2 domain-containing sensor protein
MNSHHWVIAACWALMTCIASCVRSSRHDGSAVGMALGRWAGGCVFDVVAGQAWVCIGAAGVVLVVLLVLIAFAHRRLTQVFRPA